MPVLHIMTPFDGDKRVKWEKENKKDVKKVKRLFSEKIKDGFLAFGYMAGEKTGKIIKKFDEAFDRILLIPAPAGGSSKDDPYLVSETTKLKELKALRKFILISEKMRLSNFLAKEFVRLTTAQRTSRTVPPVRAYVSYSDVDWDQEIQRKMEDLRLTIEGAMKEILLKQYLVEEDKKK